MKKTLNFFSVAHSHHAIWHFVWEYDVFAECIMLTVWLFIKVCPACLISVFVCLSLFRGVATVNIALNSLDINQCSDDDLFFAKSHRCNLQSAEVRLFAALFCSSCSSQRFVQEDALRYYRPRRNRYTQSRSLRVY